MEVVAPGPQLLLVATLAFSAAACGGVAAATSGSGTRRPESPVQVSPAQAYRASLAFARCMRVHGVPHPDPDRHGDFHLTPAQEQRMRRAGRARHEAAERACFHYLKGVVSTKPLSAHAMARAVEVLEEVRRCMKRHGFTFGRPFVRNLSRGRAFFGFRSVGSGDAGRSPKLLRAEHSCERQVGLARRIDAIVAADRGPY